MKTKQWAQPQLVLFAAVAALSIALLWVSVAKAQGPQQTAQAFAGSFEAATPDEQANQKIAEEVDRVVDQMNFFKRPFARRELKKATNPCTNLTFETQGNALTIACDDRPPATAAVDGAQTLYEDAEGSRYVLAMKAGGDEVVQVFASDDGTRTNRYTLGPQGDTLTMQTKVESGQLPEPLVYEREFKRTN